MHKKCSEQGLEFSNHSISINFYSVSEILAKALGSKEMNHCEVVRTWPAPRQETPQPPVKNKTQEVFQQRLSFPACLSLGQDP